MIRGMQMQDRSQDQGLLPIKQGLIRLFILFYKVLYGHVWLYTILIPFNLALKQTDLQLCTGCKKLVNNAALL